MTPTPSGSLDGTDQMSAITTAQTIEGVGGAGPRRGTDRRIAGVSPHPGRGGFPSRGLGPGPPNSCWEPFRPEAGAATVEVVAANAVMAGCKPEHFEVVLAAVEAMLEDRFNLRGVVTTTPSVLAAGHRVGAGCRAARNGSHRVGVQRRRSPRQRPAIGRAGEALASGTPAEPPPASRLKRCSAIPAATPSVWPNRRPARGQPCTRPEVSTPTAALRCSPVSPPPVWPCGGPTILRSTAWPSWPTPWPSRDATTPIPWARPWWCSPPNEARHLAEQGYDRAAVQQELWQQARRRIGDLLSPGVVPYAWWPDWVDADDPDTLVPVTERPEDIHVMVTGAESIPWMAVCAGWGNLGGYAVSRALDG